jgi:hypothetical protein
VCALGHREQGATGAGELDSFSHAAPVYIAAKLLSLRHATHSGDHAVTDNQCTNVFAFAFSDKFLYQYVLLLALK